MSADCCIAAVGSAKPSGSKGSFTPIRTEAPAGGSTAYRFYGSCQGFCETRRIEFGFVGVDRPGSTSDAPSEDDESRGAGQALGPVVFVEWPPCLRPHCRHRSHVEQPAQFSWSTFGEAAFAAMLSRVIRPGIQAGEGDEGIRA